MQTERCRIIERDLPHGPLDSALNLDNNDGNEIRISAVEGAANVGGVIAGGAGFVSDQHGGYSLRPSHRLLSWVFRQPRWAACEYTANAAFSVGDVRSTLNCWHLVR